MGKLDWLKSWPRFLLWSHVIGVVGFYFVIWLRTAPRKEDRVKKLPLRSENSVQSINNPLVSVIVPARNDERNMLRGVASLLEEDYEHFEVIEVYDGSSDDPPRIVDELIEPHPRGDRLFVLRLRDDWKEGWAGQAHAIH